VLFSTTGLPVLCVRLRFLCKMPIKINMCNISCIRTYPTVIINYIYNAIPGGFEKMVTFVEITGYGKLVQIWEERKIDLGD